MFAISLTLENSDMGRSFPDNQIVKENIFKGYFNLTDSKKLYFKIPVL